MTTTKRVTEAAEAGHNTLRITEAAELGHNTQRVTEAAESGHDTKRVATVGSSTTGTLNTWGATWGGFVSLVPAADLDCTWGTTWGGGFATIPASPSLGVTHRVTAAASGGQTKRVDGPVP